MLKYCAKLCVKGLFCCQIPQINSPKFTFNRAKTQQNYGYLGLHGASPRFQPRIPPFCCVLVAFCHNSCVTYRDVPPLSRSDRSSVTSYLLPVLTPSTTEHPCMGGTPSPQSPLDCSPFGGSEVPAELGAGDSPDPFKGLPAQCPFGTGPYGAAVPFVRAASRVPLSLMVLVPRTIRSIGTRLAAWSEAPPALRAGLPTAIGGPSGRISSVI